MADFELVSISDAEILVRHRTERHQYSMPFALDESGKRVLGQGSIREGNGEHSAEYFLDDARQFAELNARKHERID